MTRVLIVDDSEDMQDTYELLLEGEGYTIVKALDGAAGLSALAAERPDLVLLDMMMPDVDGLQFLRRLPIECASPRPPVIAVSGFEDYRHEALRLGASAFLHKPVEVDVLLGAVRAALAHTPLPAEVELHNREDVAAARARDARLRCEIVNDLPAETVEQIRTRLRALAGWLQRYYGYGAVFIQLLRGDELRVEAARGIETPPPYREGHQYARELAWCDDVIDAGSTVLLSDPLHHPLPHFSQHPEIAAGARFYAGVPLTTWSGAVIGSLCFVDGMPHLLHAEDMRLLEALGLHVAHALEEVAGGVDASDFVIDADGVFAAEMLPTFAQVGVERAARTGGAVGVAVVRLRRVGQAQAAARAAYARTGGAGLVIVRRGFDEIAIVEIGPVVEAHRTLAAATLACRRAAEVRSVGTAWCRMAAGAPEAAEADLGSRLVELAAEAYDRQAPVPPSELAATLI